MGIFGGCLVSGQLGTFTIASGSICSGAFYVPPYTTNPLNPCPTCQGTGITPDPPDILSVPSLTRPTVCGFIPDELIETSKRMNTDPPPEPEKRSWESWRDRPSLF